MVALVGLALLGILSPPLAGAQMCFNQQAFNQYTDGHQYSVDDVQEDWAEPQGPYKMLAGTDDDRDDALTTIEDGTIRGSFREGEISGWRTGFTWYSLNPKEVEEASMEYRVMFSAGFDWTKGGKLPGLCGGEGGQRTACPVGCSETDRNRGFSMRLMWRRDGGMVTYVYYPDKPASIRCGEDWRWSTGVQSGRWHHIRIWFRLNTGDNEDGEHKAWLDGAEVLHRTGIRYRYFDFFKISRTYITTYAGGSSIPDFAPNQDQFIYFDDFASWEGGGDNPCPGAGHSSTGMIDGDAMEADEGDADADSPASTPDVDGDDGGSGDDGEGTDDGDSGDASSGSDGDDGADSDADGGDSSSGEDVSPDEGSGDASSPESTPGEDGGDGDNKGAPDDHLGFVLFGAEAGWDIQGHDYRSSRPPRGSLEESIEYCARECRGDEECMGFTHYNANCYLKEDIEPTDPAFLGEGRFGDRWLYIDEELGWSVGADASGTGMDGNESEDGMPPDEAPSEETDGGQGVAVEPLSSGEAPAPEDTSVPEAETLTAPSTLIRYQIRNEFSTGLCAEIDISVCDGGAAVTLAEEIELERFSTWNMVETSLVDRTRTFTAQRGMRSYGFCVFWEFGLSPDTATINEWVQWTCA